MVRYITASLTEHASMLIYIDRCIYICLQEMVWKRGNRSVTAVDELVVDNQVALFVAASIGIQLREDALV